MQTQKSAAFGMLAFQQSNNPAYGLFAPQQQPLPAPTHGEAQYTRSGSTYTENRRLKQRFNQLMVSNKDLKCRRDENPEKSTNKKTMRTEDSASAKNTHRAGNKLRSVEEQAKARDRTNDGRDRAPEAKTPDEHGSTFRNNCTVADNMRQEGGIKSEHSKVESKLGKIKSEDGEIEFEGGTCRKSSTSIKCEDGLDAAHADRGSADAGSSSSLQGCSAEQTHLPIKRVTSKTEKVLASTIIKLEDDDESDAELTQRLNALDGQMVALETYRQEAQRAAFQLSQHTQKRPQPVVAPTAAQTKYGGKDDCVFTRQPSSNGVGGCW